MNLNNVPVPEKTMLEIFEALGNNKVIQYSSSAPIGVKQANCYDIRTGIYTNNRIIIL